MNVEDIKAEMISEGKNPDDYKIIITGNIVMITPKYPTQGL